MKRRELLMLVGAAAWLPLPVAAAAREPKIGYLSWFPPSMKGDLDQFRAGMKAFGYVEGRDYAVESYFAAGKPELAREIARKLVQEPVDILIAVATPAVHIAKAATQTIPIVMYSANALATGWYRAWRTRAAT